MATKTWYTRYPANLDNETSMQEVDNMDDIVDASQVNAVADAVKALEEKVGSNNLEAGSLRNQIATKVETTDPRLSNSRTPILHDIAGDYHGSSTLAELNAKISDANVVSTSDSRLTDARTPTLHAFAGAEHSASTIAAINTKISDGELQDAYKIRGRNITASAPTDGQFLQWNNSLSTIVWGNVPEQSPYPKLEYSSATVVNIVPQAGAGTTVAVKFSDGKIRSFTTSVACTMPTNLDTGAEAANTWYYVYMVPDPGNDNNIVGRFSVTGPATGPTGYTYWEYVGVVRNDGSSNFVPFDQTGSDFTFRQTTSYHQVYSVSATTPTAGSWSAINLATIVTNRAVPVTWGAIDLYGFIDGDTGTSHVYVITTHNGTPSYTPGGFNTGQTFLAEQDSGNGTCWRRFNRVGTDDQLYYYYVTSTGAVDLTVRVSGWSDAYILTKLSRIGGGGGASGGGGGASTFLELTDTPSSYSGQGLKLVRVNTGATALEFTDPPTTSPLTTKGDLYAYSTTNARLAVGGNGQHLIADSAETTGLKWSNLNVGVAYDTPMPRLTWSSATLVNVAARPGQASLVKVSLQDSIQRAFSGTLTFNPASGATDGGLDTGTEGSSRWYYLYLVPSTANNGVLAIRGSMTSPRSGGPSGYTNYKYIGAVYNDASSNLRQFSHPTPFEFMWSEQQGASIGTSQDVSPVALSLTDRVPDTASLTELDVFGQMNGDAGSGWIHIYVWADGAEGNTVASFYARPTETDTWSGCIGHGHVALPTTTKRVWYQKNGVGTISAASLGVRGWQDEFLGNITPVSIASGDGVEVMTKTLTSTFNTASTSFTNVDNGGGDALSITFTTVAGETVKAVTTATWRESGADTKGIMRLRYVLDGTPVTNSSQAFNVALNNSGELAILEYYFTNLSAGTHTISVQMKVNADSAQLDANYSGADEVPRLNIVRYKGGYNRTEYLGTSKTSSFNAETGINRVNISGSSFTATLPPAASVPNKTIKFLITANSPLYELTVDGNGSETIDGAAQVYLQAKGCSEFYSDGSAWYWLKKGQAFIDRGSMSAADYTEADLTQDFTWRSLSIASKIRNAAKGLPVEFELLFQGTAANSLSVSAWNHTSEQNMVYARSHDTGGIDRATGLAVCSAAGAIYYRCSTATQARITIRGWWVDI